MTSLLHITPAPLRKTFGRACCRAVGLLLGLSALTAGGGTARAEIYVSDSGNRTIYVFANESVATTFSTHLDQLSGLALDRARNLYASDITYGKIYKYSADGSRSTFASGLSHVFGLAFDHDGNLFAATVNSDMASSKVCKITPSGAVSTFAEGGGLKRIRGVAFDGAGNLYLADLDAGAIYRFATDGTRSIFATKIINPTGLAFDAAGNLFVCSPGVGILKIVPSGGVSTFTTNVIDPRWLAFDAAGNLYVTDVGDSVGEHGHGWVYMFTPSGERTTFADNMAYPTGIAAAVAPATPAGATGPDTPAGGTDLGLPTGQPPPAPKPSTPPQ